jgi:uncharacterized protein (TIGR02996 family)
MQEESAFLHKLLENPADDTTRLVYADWLDEQDDDVSRDKSHFLRLTVQLLEPNRSSLWRKLRRSELQPLAANLPTDWLAVVSRLKIENCGNQRAKAEQRDEVREVFQFACDLRWDQLATTDEDTVRFCNRCQEHVHYCETIMKARDHAQRGHCVAADLGIIRRDRDLERPLSRGITRIGRILPGALERLRQQQLRRGADEVSLAREKAKREKQGDDCGD